MGDLLRYANIYGTEVSGAVFNKAFNHPPNIDPTESLSHFGLTHFETWRHLFAAFIDESTLEDRHRQPEMVDLTWE
ncbi:MAG: hypothetical protein OHK0046_33730 [Anaerolineae bacterium]